MLDFKEGSLNHNIIILRKIAKNNEQPIMIDVPAGSVLFHIQHDYHSGNGVFFNKRAGAQLSRFALATGVKGTYYVAYEPQTALAEIFKDPYLEVEDLDRYYMATISPVRSLRVVHYGYIARHMGVDVTALMGESYAQTQKIADEISSYADGLWYISRKLGEPCLALWHENSDGAGMLMTREVVALSRFRYQGIDAESMLDRLQIKVM